MSDERGYMRTYRPQLSSARPRFSGTPTQSPRALTPLSRINCCDLVHREVFMSTKLFEATIVSTSEPAPELIGDVCELP